MDKPIDVLEKLHLQINDMNVKQAAAHNQMQNGLMAASTLIAKLETYGFTCESGPLERCIPFIELKKLIG